MRSDVDALSPSLTLQRAIAALRHDVSIPTASRTRHRKLVLRRLRALSWALAGVTIAWMPVDMLWLGADAATTLAPLRIALALVLLAWSRASDRLPLGVAVNGFMWLQAVGFGVLQVRAGWAPGAALEAGYGLFPFVLAAELAFLALPWPHTLVAAAAPAAQLLVLLLVQPAGAGATWSAAWLFALILLLAIWTGDAQRRLLVELLAARHDASHDTLTGLANRRSAEERLDAWRADALRHDEPLSVLMLDLDHFKRINDRHGHAVGDVVLQAVGRVLHEELRGGDLGARFGGEEFLVILPHCAGDEALETAERIRARIASLLVPADHLRLRITVSVGVASLRGNESVATLLVRADAALYAAKGRGRDRCVRAPARLGDELPLALDNGAPLSACPAPPVPEFP